MILRDTEKKCEETEENMKETKTGHGATVKEGEVKERKKSERTGAELAGEPLIAWREHDN